MGVSFEGVLAFSPEELKRNEDYSASLGLPSVGSLQVAGPLAIVGGGLSINQYKYTLQSWPGEIWAVNRTWKWCKENEIDATFFSFDPNPSVSEMVEGADKAILGNRVNSEVYKRLAGARIHVGEGNRGGTTSAGAALVAGLEANAPTVTLFGCDGCHQPDHSHAYAHYEPEYEMVVWCNGMHFYTTPQLLMGAVELATMLKSAPELIKERSGGLLRALIEDTNGAKVVGGTANLLEKMHGAA